MQKYLWAIIAVVILYYYLRKSSPDTLAGLPLPSSITYYYADWCNACKQYGPKLATWARKNRIPVKKIKIQSWQDPIVESQGISHLPYTLADGKVVPAREILKWS